MAGPVTYVSPLFFHPRPAPRYYGPPHPDQFASDEVFWVVLLLLALCLVAALVIRLWWYFDQN